jgi:hypothetical protein
MARVLSHAHIAFSLLLSAAVVLGSGSASAASKKYGHKELYDYIRVVALQTRYPIEVRRGAFPRRDQADPQFVKGVAAYFWGLPRVEMRRTQQSVLNQYSLNINEMFDSNTRNTGTSVVAPNLDVLNSTAFIDFSDPQLPGQKQAFVLTVPDTRQGDGGRGTFNIMQVLDADTNVQQAVGTCYPTCDPGSADFRNQGGNFLLSGPGYNGGIPQSLEDVIQDEIPLKTNQAWLIGRTEVDAYVNCPLGEPGTAYEDLVAACVDAEAFDLSSSRGADEVGDPIVEGQSFEFAREFRLTSLEDFELDPTTPAEPALNPRDPAPEIDPPYGYPMFAPYLSDGSGAQGVVWNAEDFFEYLGASVEQNGISKPNKKIYRQFKSLGLRKNGYKKPRKTGVLDARNEGVYRASDFLAYLAQAMGAASGSDASSWTVNTTLGTYDPDPTGWLLASAVAAVGLGANRAEDGIYPLALQDSAGCALDGSGANYTLTFTAAAVDAPPVADGGFPPVSSDAEESDGPPLGFWSLTVYDLNGTIFASQEGNSFYGAPVYSLGSIQLENLMGEAVPSEDVTFLLQNQAPADESLPFWLPVPDAEFEVILRIYAPDMDYFPIPYDCDDEKGLRNNACTEPAPNKYIPPNLMRVEPSSSECNVAEERGNGVNVEALPRKTRKLLRRLSTDGNFLDQFR